MNKAYCSGKLRLMPTTERQEQKVTDGSLNVLSSTRAAKMHIMSLPITSCLTISMVEYAKLTSKSQDLHNLKP